MHVTSFISPVMFLKAVYIICKYHLQEHSCTLLKSPFVPSWWHPAQLATALHASHSLIAHYVKIYFLSEVWIYIIFLHTSSSWAFHYDQAHFVQMWHSLSAFCSSNNLNLQISHPDHFSPYHDHYCFPWYSALFLVMGKPIMHMSPHLLFVPCKSQHLGVVYCCTLNSTLGCL